MGSFAPITCPTERLRRKFEKTAKILKELRDKSLGTKIHTCEVLYVDFKDKLDIINKETRSHVKGRF